jgi:hypothetical protein
MADGEDGQGSFPGAAAAGGTKGTPPAGGE